VWWMSTRLRRTLMHENGDPAVQRLQRFSGSAVLFSC